MEEYKPTQDPDGHGRPHRTVEVSATLADLAYHAKIVRLSIDNASASPSTGDPSPAEGEHALREEEEA